MIKICHIVNLITGKSDGVYAHLKMIFQTYDRDNFKHFLIFQGGEKVEEELKELGIQVIVSESLRKKISFKAFFDIYKVVQEKKIDIIHIHLIKPYVLAGAVNIFSRKKFIFNYHGLFLKNNKYYNFIEKALYYLFHFLNYLFGKVDAVLVPSQRSKELLMNETKLFPEPQVYYNGYTSYPNLLRYDGDLSDRLSNIKSNNFVIAFVGRLEIEKRVDITIKIFCDVLSKRSNGILLIFGDGNLKKELIGLSKDLAIESKVMFFDYVPNISNYFKFIDVLLFTSDREGLPLTVFEAMANQLPIIAPNVGGFREILEDYNCGMIYETGNMKQAEEKILQLIEDPEFRKKLGENGKSAVETQFTEKKFIDQIEKVYLNLMGL